MGQMGQPGSSSSGSCRWGVLFWIRREALTVSIQHTRALLRLGIRATTETYLPGQASGIMSFVGKDKNQIRAGGLPGIAFSVGVETGAKVVVTIG